MSSKKSAKSQLSEDKALQQRVDAMMAAKDEGVNSLPAVSTALGEQADDPKEVYKLKTPEKPPIVMELADDDKPQETTDDNAPADDQTTDDPLDNNQTDEAVDDIVVNESDTLLAVEDALVSRKQKAVQLPLEHHFFRKFWTALSVLGIVLGILIAVYLFLGYF
jgi:hypothetical protein